MQIILLLLSLVVWHTSASNILQHNYHDKAANPFRRASSVDSKPKFGPRGPIVARAPRTIKCRPPKYEPANVGKTSKVQATLSNNGTILRRMKLPGDEGMDTFMKDEAEVDLAKEVVWTLTEKNEAGGKDLIDVNTSVLEEFKDYQEREMSLFGQGLEGCTMLAIVSRKGVYLSHWWETLSFNIDLPDDPAPAPAEVRRLRQQALTKTILRPLRDGVIKGQLGSIQVSLRRNANRIDDDYLHAFLVRPSTHSRDDGTDENRGYRDEWDQIKNEVFQYLPKLNTLDRWREITYDVVTPEERDQEALTKTSRGRVLLKYDSKHPVAGGSTVQRTTLWVENEQIYVDEW
ncbi:Nn.00g012260.m01.CDS01 [Neocucurbitaria sp. VM-36]